MAVLSANCKHIISSLQGGILYLGKDALFCEVVLENCWNHIQSDGQMLFGRVRTVNNGRRETKQEEVRKGGLKENIKG